MKERQLEGCWWVSQGTEFPVPGARPREREADEEGGKQQGPAAEGSGAGWGSRISPLCSVDSQSQLSKLPGLRQDSQRDR